MDLHMIVCEGKLMKHKVVPISRGSGQFPRDFVSSCCNCIRHHVGWKPDFFILRAKILNASSYPAGSYPICQFFASSDVFCKVC